MYLVHETPHRPIYPPSMVMMVPDVCAGKSEAKKSPYLGCDVVYRMGHRRLGKRPFFSQLEFCISFQVDPS